MVKVKNVLTRTNFLSDLHWYATAGNYGISFDATGTIVELKKKATAQILSLLHTAGKWSAFMRKTEYYKFKRLPDEGGNIRVSNPCFIRDKPDMLAQIESKYMSKDQVKEVKVKQVKPKKELKVTFEISRPTPKRPRPFEFSQDAIPLPHGWKMSKLGGEDSDWSAYLPKEI